MASDVPQLLYRDTCGDGKTCPAAYRQRNGKVLVQGHFRNVDGIDLGPGEILLEVPQEVILEAARALERGAI